MQKWKTFTSSSRMWKICCAVIVRRACNWHSHQVVFLFRQVAAVISQNCHLLYIFHQWMEAVLVKPIWTCSCKWHQNVCLCLLCVTDCINADLLPLAFLPCFTSCSRGVIDTIGGRPGSRKSVGKMRGWAKGGGVPQRPIWSWLL